MQFMNDFFIQSRRVLKRGAFMALVVGESSSRTSTTNELIDGAKSAGFNLCFRADRDIKQSRRRLMAKVSGEDVLVFKK
jgi:hypothetical protein